MLKDFLEGKPLRHPLHPMLVHFPIGLFLLSFFLDLASLAFPFVPNLVRGSFYAMLLGVITALLAAVPGFVDYTDIRSDHPAKRIATIHLMLNLIVVASLRNQFGRALPAACRSKNYRNAVDLLVRRHCALVCVQLSRRKPRLR